MRKSQHANPSLSCIPFSTTCFAQGWAYAVRGQDARNGFAQGWAYAVRGQDARNGFAQGLVKIRKEIKKGNRNGGRVLIISNRLYGSGPYQRLLEGAEFKMNGQGLVPIPT